ncbi:hypothetical protein IU469_30150 [Nocardia puris]|uniref:hypothetical protein n=1 Tax=Nocardia puris TaxID=208602 RepID=UPI00189509CC|nr:hypothetical protein [Nocardia puris]MBF6369943.1 hypothetical protein [Nocardia puris]
MSLPTFYPHECRKATLSSAQQNCVRVGRKAGWTILWDDKLTPTIDIAHPLPADQILVFTDAEFDEVQTALRKGISLRSARHALRVHEQPDGLVEFTAASDNHQPEPGVRLRFDEKEVSAFLDGVRRKEFDREQFGTV